MQLLALWVEVMPLIKPTMVILGDPSGMALKMVAHTVGAVKCQYTVSFVKQQKVSEARKRLCQNCPDIRLTIHGEHRSNEVCRRQLH